MPCVIGFGSALLDQLARVPDAFLDGVSGNKGGMELIDDEQRRALLAALPVAPETAPGGSAANTIVGLGHLGMPCRLLAKTGADEAGEAYRRHAAAAGVDLTACKTHPSMPTGTCVSLITPDSERTMRTFLGAASTLSAAEISAADFHGCTHLHTEGYMLFDRELVTHVLDLATHAGCTVGIDISSPEVVMATRDILPDLLSRYADIVYANETEAEALTGSSDPREALRAMTSLCPVVVVKIGAEGALLAAGGEYHHVPAVRVSALDTTGAGDLWATGFLYGHLRGWPLTVAARAGALVAARVVQVLGASMPPATWADIRADLRRLAPSHENHVSEKKPS